MGLAIIQPSEAFQMCYNELHSFESIQEVINELMILRTGFNPNIRFSRVSYNHYLRAFLVHIENDFSSDIKVTSNPFYQYFIGVFLEKDFMGGLKVKQIQASRVPKIKEVYDAFHKDLCKLLIEGIQIEKEFLDLRSLEINQTAKELEELESRITFLKQKQHALISELRGTQGDFLKEKLEGFAFTEFEEFKSLTSNPSLDKIRFVIQGGKYNEQ